MRFNIGEFGVWAGYDLYHIAVSFVLYSILGWFVESVYMSICNKKITNRGFAKGPFCPIYGFGATIGSILLTPFANSLFLVYIIGAFSATAFEYLSGLFMIRVLGDLWWDYNDKPYNYKGIICLESTIAWGFYAIGVVIYLNKFIFGLVDRIDPVKMTFFVEVVLVIAVIDYLFRLAAVFSSQINGMKKRVVTVYQSIHDRWFE